MSKQPDRVQVTMDGNEAAAWVAHKLSEVIAIYPITPSSPMGEWCDQWSSEGQTNIWGAVPAVIEMQSEGGAAGALHGALQAGSLAATFTSSQGLLLMIPNMYKIAGELTPAVFHIAARSIAAQALSIFGDHQDVMAARQTGFALLSSANVQEVMDMALIAHAATLESRIPFMHFFDGFRTSHEVNKIEPLSREDLRAMINDDWVRIHRARSLSPDHPVVRGTAQNPDVYFQGREAVNPYHLACPTIVQGVMDRFAALTGRQYRLFDYTGAPDAERVAVIMGSGGDTLIETVKALSEMGEKVGALQVRLYRPFSSADLIAALPATTRRIAVLDRTKEPGATGEPLYQDIVTAVSEQWPGEPPRVVGGRYGLSSKEFTPAMAKAVFDELRKDRPRNHFTIGIVDDVTHTSLEWDAAFSTEDPGTKRCLFYGLGADGTVGANKNSIKIIGEDANLYAQGYFVYDSKKSGSVTVSHLRFGPRPIRSPYLITSANFIACHQFQFLERFDMLSAAQPGATFLLNSPFGPEEVWANLPAGVQRQITEKQMKFYVIDAESVARETGMGTRINTIMQTCFFAISGILPREEAIAAIKDAIRKTYGKRGEVIVRKNFAAVDAALEHLCEVRIKQSAGANGGGISVPAGAPAFVRDFVAPILAGMGDSLPVSMMPSDGTFPVGTAKWEKRNISSTAPIWDEELCIQCGKCVMVCPHGVIRSKIITSADTDGAPAGFLTAPARWKEFSGRLYTLQVAAEDCTGCALCVAVCPAKSKSDVKHKAVNMEPRAGKLAREQAHWDFFVKLPDPVRGELNHGLVKDVQALEPLFEFSGACLGCGETPYIKLLTQLFGDRTVIANATGCSSIYGGNLPTTPYTANAAGLGPAWSNSLFEDNAEFGLGMRLSFDKQQEFARKLVAEMATEIGEDLARAILDADQSTEEGVFTQRRRVGQLNERLALIDGASSRHLKSLSGALVKKNVWIVGGDGWAYDIGYGGLDHVLASGRNVNILVLDTEVYSNTGGQMSKATPRAAVAKFAAAGKPAGKKDLAMMAVMYANVYVARVAMGANDTHTIKAFREAESYDGPSLIIAYSHCIAHGYDMLYGLDQQKAAVNSGHWPLFRYDPRLAGTAKNPFQLDSRKPTVPLKQYAYNEGRYTMLAHSDAPAAERLLRAAEQDIQDRWELYEYLAARPGAPLPKPEAARPAGAEGPKS
jgi:pyruvate-ferredoxin/flavodoxin oxidoreductase